MKKLMLGLLSAQILLSTVTVTVMAQPSEDPYADPFTESPVEEPPVTDPLPEEPEPTEPSWTPDPTTPAPQPEWTPEQTLPPVSEEVITEASEESEEVTSEETTETSEVDDAQAVKDLVGNALENPAYAMALEDYVAITGEGFIYTNPMDESIIGTSMEDVQAQFETYLAEKEMQEEAQAEISKNAVTEDMEDVQVLQYHYYYAGEPQGEDTKVATLKFFFKENQLFASSVLNHVPILSKEVSPETLAAIENGEMTFEGLIEANPIVTGFVHKYVDGTETGVAVLAGKKDDQTTLHYVNLAHEFLAVLDTKTTQENIATDQLMDSFITGKEVQPKAPKDKKSLATDKDSENQKTSESPKDESTQADKDTTQAEEVTTDAGENSGQAMVDRVPIDFEFPEDKTVEVDDLTKGVESFKTAVEEGQAMSLDQVTEWFGPATVEEEGQYKYVATSQEKVLLVLVSFDAATQEVTSVKVDQRTPKLFEKFGITVDDLFAISENKDTIVDQLKEKVGDVTIFEYLPQETSLRYLWTSFEDEAIQNIEVTKDLNANETELLYYEP